MSHIYRDRDRAVVVVFVLYNVQVQCHQMIALDEPGTKLRTRRPRFRCCAVVQHLFRVPAAAVPDQGHGQGPIVNQLATRSLWVQVPA